MPDVANMLQIKTHICNLIFISFKKTPDGSIITSF